MNDTQSCQELQTEELSVLRSIYDGDDCFIEQPGGVAFQYKYGEDGENTSFILEVRWIDGYPLEKLPVISMNAFYNSHVNEEVKQQITAEVTEQAEAMLGLSMTYTLFEWVKDNCDRLMQQQLAASPGCTSSASVVPTTLGDTTSEQSLKAADNGTETAESGAGTVPDSRVTATKQPKLSKQQKRRAWDRVQGGGKGGVSSSIDGRPRGWDWVDIIRHLSQTGSVDS